MVAEQAILPIGEKLAQKSRRRRGQAKGPEPLLYALLDADSEAQQLAPRSQF